MSFEKGSDSRVRRHLESDGKALERKLVELRKQINQQIERQSEGKEQA